MDLPACVLDRELERAPGFFRSVRATRFVQQGEALLAASA
jgi:hypothetical protein